MPWKVFKVRNKNCYEVRNIQNGYVHAKCTTKEKAEAQLRLLESTLKKEKKKKK